MTYRDSHPTDRDLLLAADGEPFGAEQRAVDAHVQDCDACRARIVQLETTLNSVADLYVSGDEASDRDPRSRARLAAALDRAADEWAASWMMRWRAALMSSRPLVTVGVAASLVLVTAIALRSSVMSPDLDARSDAPDRSALPVAVLTPGAVAPISTAALCAGDRPSRVVTAAVRDQVVRSYGMAAMSEQSYELDALITPELGGSTDARNLWPQRYESPVWNARVKDELERLLPRLVCEGKVDLAVAQRDIAADWIAAYQKYFNTNVPLQAHLGPATDDDDDLEILPAIYQTVARR
jgi:hypothetical protein